MAEVLSECLLLTRATAMARTPKSQTSKKWQNLSRAMLREMTKPFLLV